MNNRVLIVELAGPAGVGKTTIRNALCKANGNIYFGAVPKIRELRNLPFFAWNWILLLPVFFSIYRNKKQESLTAQRMVLMAILNGWSRQLKTASPIKGNTIILDQGPIYMLAELLRHGLSNLPDIASKWWEHVCSDWANLLDMVICLDAPDAILLQRNRTREKSHGIKKNDDQWAAQFLVQCRDAQSKVLTSMTENPGKVKVTQIDTSQSLSETVQKISDLLDKEEKIS